MLLMEILERLKNSSATLTFLSESGEETLKTFDALHEDVLALLQQLKRIGVAPAMHVGIYAPNCYEWMVWDVALMTLGCISVALPQEKLGEPLERIVERHALHLIAVDSRWVSAGSLQLEYVVAIDSTSFSTDKKVALVVLPDNNPATHSFVFSSGTTGKTKGLIISRPGTERLLSLFADAFGVVDGDRLLTFLPFANYQQRMAYYFCLYHAIDFVCLPFPRLFAGLKKYKPTYVIAPPVFYEAAHNMAMVDMHAVQSGNAGTTSGIGDRLRTMLGGNIRYMITGMAPIKRQTLDFFWKHGVALFEAFGITEAGMVTWNKPGHVKLGSVGKPAEPGSVTLTSEGEVIVTRDALLSLGYFDASDEDMRTTFVAENSVATGDIAEFDSDGFLTIIGRKKDAIITNSGEKFHPEKIESLIQRESAVKSAVILGGQNLPCITAVVVVENKERTDVTDRIREQISLMNVDLPVFQRVKKIVFTDTDFTVDNGLRTKNMKLNRKAIYQSFFGATSVEEQSVKGFANA